MTLVLNRARLALEAHQDVYGDPAECLSKIARRWSERFGIPVTADQVCLCMIDLKVVRLDHKHHEDGPVDIAGYAALMTGGSDVRD